MSKTLFNHFLNTHPIKTNMLISSTLAFLGDSICQLYFSEENKFDKKRNSIVTCMAVAGTIPQHRWINIYLPRIASKITLKGFKQALLFTLLDQICFAPAFNGFWLFSAKFMETRDISKSVENVRDKWWAMMIVDCSFWPFVSMFNFSFIALKYRLSFLMTFNLVWNVFRSWIQFNEINNCMVVKS
jgi:hypothetical protein